LSELEQGPSGGLEELVTFDKCEHFTPVHDASFTISDLTHRHHRHLLLAGDHARGGRSGASTRRAISRSCTSQL